MQYFICSIKWYIVRYGTAALWDLWGTADTCFKLKSRKIDLAHTCFLKWWILMSCYVSYWIHWALSWHHRYDLIYGYLVRYEFFICIYKSIQIRPCSDILTREGGNHKLTYNPVSKNLAAHPSLGEWTISQYFQQILFWLRLVIILYLKYIKFKYIFKKESSGFTNNNDNNNNISVHQFTPHHVCIHPNGKIDIMPVVTHPFQRDTYPFTAQIFGISFDIGMYERLLLSDNSLIAIAVFKLAPTVFAVYSWVQTAFIYMM